MPRMKRALSRLKLEHREALTEIYRQVGVGTFIFSTINLSIHQQTLRSMSYSDLLIDCGKPIKSSNTKSWKINPEYVPELIEMFGEIESTYDLNTEIGLMKSKQYEYEMKSKMKVMP